MIGGSCGGTERAVTVRATITRMSDSPLSTTALLDRIFWHTLSGDHARFAEGAGGARRYARGFSPIIAFEDDAHPDFAALTPFCGTDEHFYVAGWNGAAPAGWRIELEAIMLRMVWDSAASPPTELATGAQTIGAQHLAQVLALAELTRPGPFGPRTIELGDYVGWFEGDRLVAMAGERTQAGPLREVSGVCTHPDFQGQGHARRLMNTLIARQLQRGEIPFLNVLKKNTGAHQLYRRMGFVDHCETVVRVVSRS